MDRGPQHTLGILVNIYGSLSIGRRMDAGAARALVRLQPPPRPPPPPLPRRMMVGFLETWLPAPAPVSSRDFFLFPPRTSVREPS